MGQESAINTKYRFIFCALAFFSFAATEVKAFDSFYQVKGQSTGLIYSVHQGKNSVYLGGENGLFKLTGNHSKFIPSTEKLLDNFEVESVVEDRNGNIWVSTFGNGILVFSEEMRKVRHLKKQDGLHSEFCMKLVINSGRVIANCDEALTIIDTYNFEISNYVTNKHSAFTKIEDFSVDLNGGIWFFDSNNKIFNITNNKVEPLNNYEPDSLALNQIQSIAFDNSNDLWVGTSQRLLKGAFQDEYKLSVVKSGLNVTTIKPFSDNKLIIFADSFYVFEKVERILEEVKAISSSNKVFVHEIYDIDVSSKGEVIFSAPLVGVGVFTELSTSIENFPRLNNKITNIQASYALNDNFLLFAIGNDLYFYDTKTKKLTLEVNDIGVVTALEVDYSNSRVLLGVDGVGLISIPIDIPNRKIEGKSEILMSVDDGMIVDILVFNDSTLLYAILDGEEQGLFKLSNTELDRELDELIIDNVILTEEKQLLLATRFNGLYNYSEDIFLRSEMLHGHITNCLYEDTNNNVWFCNDGAGLGYIDNLSKELVFIDPIYTAGSRHIRELVQDSAGYFWVMTNQGMVRFDHQTLSSIKLSPEDGILDLDFEITASMNVSRDLIFIAGDRHNYLINTEKANLYLNNRMKRETEALLISLDTKKGEKQNFTSKQNELIFALTSNKSVELENDEFLFNIMFGVDSLIDRKTVRFQYRLLGLNDYWITTNFNENYASYNTLPSGDYTFQVRVLDFKSNVVQPITSLQIKVLPPIWLTWQAYTIYFVLTLILLFLVYKYRAYLSEREKLRLETSIFDRTCELATSQNRLSSILTRKEAFFEHISHEFKTPITLISGPVRELEGSVTCRQQKKHVSLIKSGSERLANLADQVLDLTEEDTSELSAKSSYNLPTSIDTIIDSFKPMMNMKGQQLQMENRCTKNVHLVRDSLEKILSNILLNAYKYTPENGRIFVKAIDQGDHLILTVLDEGEGIPKSDLNSIFKRFTRLNWDSRSGGKGLGLSVVEDLVKMNNGVVEVESELGKGSTFVVKIPIQEVTTDPIIEAFKTSVGRSDKDISRDELSTDIYFNPKQLDTVLIVEDEPELRGLIYDILASDYHVLLAENGEEGHRLSVEIIPDLIISDLVMPKMDGFELVDRIRDDEVTCHIPFILLTARGNANTKLDSCSHLVDDFLKKPFDGAELKAVIKKLISIRRSIAEKFGVSTKKDETFISLDKQTFYSERDKQFFNKFVSWLHANYQLEGICRGTAARSLAISERQLNRKLKAIADSSFSDLLRKFRLAKAKKLLIEGRQISLVAYDCGFSSPAYFSNCFKDRYGESPKAFIDKLR